MSLSMDTWRIQAFSTAFDDRGCARAKSAHHQRPPQRLDARAAGPSGVGERVFVLPDRLVRSNGAASDAPTLDGDVYTYGILPEVQSCLKPCCSGPWTRAGDAALTDCTIDSAQIEERVAGNCENRVIVRTLERVDRQALARWACSA